MLLFMIVVSISSIFYIPEFADPMLSVFHSNQYSTADVTKTVVCAI